MDLFFFHFGFGIGFEFEYFVFGSAFGLHLERNFEFGYGKTQPVQDSSFRCKKKDTHKMEVSRYSPFNFSKETSNQTVVITSTKTTHLLRLNLHFKNNKIDRRNVIVNCFFIIVFYEKYLWLLFKCLCSCGLILFWLRLRDRIRVSKFQVWVGFRIAFKEKFWVRVR